MTRLRRLAARTAALVGLMCLGVIHPSAGFARSAPAEARPEYLIKAAYLYHFAMFIEWPADAFGAKGSPIVIGIVGSDPFGTALDATVSGKKIDGRAVVVKRLQWGDDLRQSHILFVGESEAGRIGELARRVEGRPLLIVGESADLAKRGATIGFRIDDGRVRFDINADAAARARLKISSKLLSVAHIVRGS
jgi:hypothetical protein